VRVEAGAVVDEFAMSGIGQVVARHTRTRTPDGGVTWACMFTVVADGASDLAVVHRLSAPTLAEARRNVRNAIEFMAGRAMTTAWSSEPTSTPSPLSPPPLRRATDKRPNGVSAPRIPVFDLPPLYPAPLYPVDDDTPAPLLP
jgi:hypothetical protein